MRGKQLSGFTLYRHTAFFLTIYMQKKRAAKVLAQPPHECIPIVFNIEINQKLGGR